MQEYKKNIYEYVDIAVAAIEKTIATVKSSVTTLTNNLAKLTTKVTQQDSDINGVRNTVNTQGVSITTLRTDVNELQATTPPKGGYNRDLYESYGAVFNEETGYYEMNEIYNLTEKDMANIVAVSKRSQNFADSGYIYPYLDVRTLPRLGYYCINFSNCYIDCRLIEKIYTQQVTSIINMNNMFKNCYKLTDVLNYMIKRESASIVSIWDAPLLNNIRIGRINTDVNISTCPAISLESLTYWVENATNTTAVTWSVHEGIYAKMIDEEDAEGWHELYLAAQAKNIAFATTTTAATMALLDEIPTEITVEEIGGKLYMIAPAGYYITKADESIELTDRLFVTSRILLDGETVAGWRLATAAEVEAQRMEIEKDMPPVEGASDETSQKS